MHEIINDMLGLKLTSQELNDIAVFYCDFALGHKPDISMLVTAFSGGLLKGTVQNITEDQPVDYSGTVMCMMLSGVITGMLIGYIMGNTGRINFPEKHKIGNVDLTELLKGFPLRINDTGDEGKAMPAP